MQKVIIMVLPHGLDVVAEFVSETDTHLFVKNPKLLIGDPVKKTLSYTDFCVHRDPNDKAEVPIAKSILLTWYNAKPALSKNYIEAERAKNLNDMGIILPPSATGQKITF